MVVFILGFSPKRSMLSGGIHASSPLIAQEREMALDFSLRNLSGRQESLKNYRGKVILLNFWATWCPPCREEMPSMERLYHSLKDQGLVVLGISSDAFGERSVKPFVDEFRLTFPVLLDPDSRVTNVYMVRYRPTSYLIDAQGRIITRIVGPRDWMSDNILESIRGILLQSSTH